MKTRKRSISAKLMMSITLMLIVSFSLLGIISYARISDMLIETAKEDAMGMAKVAALEIDGAAFSSIQTNDDIAYQEVYDILAKYKIDENIQFIYSMGIDGDNLYFVVDTDDNEPADLFEEYELLEDMQPALDGEVCCDQEISSDEWGSYFSAYAPIFDGAKVVGIVGCDIPIEAINVKLSGLKQLVFILVFIFTVVCVVITYFISRGIHMNLKSLYEKACELNSGDANLDKSIEITSGDELELIAGEFNGFISTIHHLIMGVTNTADLVAGNSDNVQNDVLSCNQNLGMINDVLSELSARMQETSASANVILDSLGQSADMLHEAYNEAEEKSKMAEGISFEARDKQEMIAEQSVKAKDVVNKLQEELAVSMKQCEAIYQIEEMTDGILKIASKTQMLALNASIESARAGTFGKGFSVIADDVATLSRQISSLVGNIRETNTTVVEAVEKMMQEVDKVSTFLHDSVLPDYDLFQQIGGEYSDRMTQTSNILSQFDETLHQLHGTVSQIQQSVADIDVVIGEAAHEVATVHENSVQLKDRMNRMSEDAVENHRNAATLANEVGVFHK